MAGVEGSVVKQSETEPYGEYYRVLKNVKLDPPGEVTERLSKIFEKIRDFLKKCQKLKNGYFLGPKSAKSCINHHFRAPRPVLT